MRLSERKLAILSGVFVAATMTAISQHGDQIVTNLAKMAGQPRQVVDTAARLDARSGAGVPSISRYPVRSQPLILPDPRRNVPRTSDTARMEAFALPQEAPEAVATPLTRRLDLSARTAALDTQRLSPPSDAELDLSRYGTPCQATLRADALPGAMVSLSLDAPCQARQRVTIRHGGLEFDTRTSAYGGLSLMVPALERQAAYSVYFGDGQSASATVTVPDGDDVDRVVLQWQGAVDLDLHALEFGAAEGSNGHVRPGAGRSPLHALRVGGGFLTELGDPGLDRPRLAEIYSLPHGTRTPEGAVRLMVAARSSAQSCGEPVEALTLRRTSGTVTERLAVSFRMPPCGEATQTLLLKNALQDLKIARN
ncbi:hypothetical protein DDZ14_04915 [Maritimibacter sp. 55A14]|uniref:hypothetical protein n=1 Tax=Maritimibacter sp. 55A14 TaxID=2174844 RepID=UPI000D621290|nr:hypothetical protein [Maritimibacter sp. 55A14]PWE33534.1 hypothetical protein DDZ14_04915 [Maritimibacter sp. 55A14]